METAEVVPSKKERPKRKYASYNALDIQLRKSKIEKSGVVTSLLLDTFHENAGILHASDVAEKGLCGDKPGDFSRWRQSLIDAGWLSYSYKDAEKSGDLARHRPGPKLVKYLNEEILKTQQVVTTDQLYNGLAGKADKAEMEKLQNEVEALKRELEEQKLRNEAHRMRFATFQARASQSMKALRGMAVECLGENASDEAIEKMVDDLIARYVQNEKAPGEGPTRLAN